ncbi:MAG: cysteine-rich small domain-containing protein [Oscillospiraceae bacterium]
MEQERWRDKHYACYQNRECEYYPCHKGIPEEQFSCLFCYCPLYALGDRCGGDFTYTQKGTKNCSGCTVPHKKDNYGRITARFQDLAALAARGEGQE